MRSRAISGTDVGDGRPGQGVEDARHDRARAGDQEQLLFGHRGSSRAKVPSIVTKRPGMKSRTEGINVDRGGGESHGRSCKRRDFPRHPSSDSILFFRPARPKRVKSLGKTAAGFENERLRVAIDWIDFAHASRGEVGVPRAVDHALGSQLHRDQARRYLPRSAGRLATGHSGQAELTAGLLDIRRIMAMTDVPQERLGNTFRPRTSTQRFDSMRSPERPGPSMTPARSGSGQPGTAISSSPVQRATGNRGCIRWK
ncbi:MAG: hypothetical protein MZV70_52755 [Desulfobacterales bacterium]|nr:hypothetical protein [Desulfobacterales bacterium]